MAPKPSKKEQEKFNLSDKSLDGVIAEMGADMVLIMAVKDNVVFESSLAASSLQRASTTSPPVWPT